MMLQTAYMHLKNRKVFDCRGSSDDKALLKQMLGMIVKTTTGRDLINRIGTECIKQHRPIVIKMKRLQDGILGLCDPTLIVQIGRLNQEKLTQKQKDQLLFQQAMTLTHELGHVLQFLKKEDKLNNTLPVLDRFYAQVWAEAEADLWARDVETELAHLYPSLTNDMSLLKRRFKSRADFVRSFFIKGRDYRWMRGAVDMIIFHLMHAHQIVMPNQQSKAYFTRLMNGRFKRMRLDLNCAEMPLKDCFWIRDLENNAIQIYNEDQYAVVGKDGQVLVLCDQKEKPSKIKTFGNDFMESLKKAAQTMPISDQKAAKVIRANKLKTIPFRLNAQSFNALEQLSGHFDGPARRPFLAKKFEPSVRHQGCR